MFRNKFLWHDGNEYQFSEYDVRFEIIVFMTSGSKSSWSIIFKSKLDATYVLTNFLRFWNVISM